MTTDQPTTCVAKLMGGPADGAREVLPMEELRGEMLPPAQILAKPSASCQNPAHWSLYVIDTEQMVIEVSAVEVYVYVHTPAVLS